MSRVYRVLKASQQLAFIPIRDWYKHIKAAIEEVDHADADSLQ